MPLPLKSNGRYQRLNVKKDPTYADGNANEPECLVSYNLVAFFVSVCLIKSNGRNQRLASS